MPPILKAFSTYTRIPHTYTYIVPTTVVSSKNRQIDERTPHESTWAPLLWALKLIQRARTEGKIVIEAPVYGTLVAGFDYIETSNGKILNYGWVNFPLAYTQVRESRDR